MRGVGVHRAGILKAAGAERAVGGRCGRVHGQAVSRGGGRVRRLRRAPGRGAESRSAWMWGRHGRRPSAVVPSPCERRRHDVGCRREKASVCRTVQAVGNAVASLRDAWSGGLGRVRTESGRFAGPCVGAGAHRELRPDGRCGSPIGSDRPASLLVRLPRRRQPRIPRSRNGLLKHVIDAPRAGAPTSCQAVSDEFASGDRIWRRHRRGVINAGSPGPRPASVGPRRGISLHAPS